MNFALVNPTIDLGVFAGFVLMAAGSLAVAPKLPYLVFLAPAILAGLAFVMFTHHDVVLTKHIDGYEQEEIAQTIERNATGHIVTNATTTNKVIVQPHKETVPVINQYHNTYGWIFTGSSLIITYFLMRWFFNI